MKRDKREFDSDFGMDFEARIEDGWFFCSLFLLTPNKVKV